MTFYSTDVDSAFIFKVLIKCPLYTIKYDEVDHGAKTVFWTKLPCETLGNLFEKVTFKFRFGCDYTPRRVWPSWEMNPCLLDSQDPALSQILVPNHESQLASLPNCNCYGMTHSPVASDA